MKTESPQQGHSINALSTMTGFDRKTLSKWVVDLEPVRIEGKTKFYRLEDIQARMAEKPSKGLRDQKLEQEIRKLRINNDKAEGKLMEKAIIAATIRNVLSQAATISESKLVNEWPTAVAGLQVAEARVYGRRLHDLLMADFQKLETLFPE